MNETERKMKISWYEFNLANDAFYDYPEDPDLNEQGNRRQKLAAAFAAVGVEIEGAPDV